MANKSPLLYPWAELYDVESGVRQIHQPGETGRMGRPVSPVNRIKTSVTMTDDEKRIYDKLAYQLGVKLHPNKVTKGQVLGLALRLLDARFNSLPRSLDSWKTLAAVLFPESENGTE